MGRHLDIDELRRHVGKADQVLAGNAGEHHLFIGVFVIDAEEAAGAVRIEREEGDVVVVIAELLQLRGGALLQGIEGRRIGKKRIAPSEQNLRPIALGDMMGLVDAGFDLREAEAILGALGAAARALRAAPVRTAIAAAAAPSVPRITSRRL